MSKAFSKVTSVLFLSLLFALSIHAATIEVISSGAFMPRWRSLNLHLKKKPGTKSISNLAPRWVHLKRPSLTV